jgi:hypothetical protein
MPKLQMAIFQPNQKKEKLLAHPCCIYVFVCEPELNWHVEASGKGRGPKKGEFL